MVARRRKDRDTVRYDVRFYDETYLAEKLGVSRRHFHRHIKPIMLADFPEIVAEIGQTNVDIGIDRLDQLYLASTDHQIIRGTGYSIFDYI